MKKIGQQAFDDLLALEKTWADNNWNFDNTEYLAASQAEEEDKDVFQAVVMEHIVPRNHSKYVDWFLWFVGLDPLQDHALSHEECVIMVQQLKICVSQSYKNLLDEIQHLPDPLEAIILSGNYFNILLYFSFVEIFLEFLDLETP